MMLRSGLFAFFLLLLASGALGFGITPNGGSLRHQEITERALLNSTLLVCRDVARAQGRNFIPPSGTLTAENVASACSSPMSAKPLSVITTDIKLSNIATDILHVTDANYHFDSETFDEAKKLITDGLSAVKASIKQNNFAAARLTLGPILHTLQDFYSHSNWVELGNRVPNTNLIKPGRSIGKTAEKGRATCRNCIDDDCTNNILEDILQVGILTTGYFSLLPTSHKKPAGKCSHGGLFDLSRYIQPTGGINKDTLTAEHGFLHLQAAAVAMAATGELMEDIRKAVGDSAFFQLMGIFRGSNKALCFVIDTTSSIIDSIAAYKTLMSSIIDKTRGTDDQPSLFILVPFNYPTSVPVMRTTDPEVFRAQINALTKSGDFPEFSLSGLQLALTAARPGSDVFLFTDATAKDPYLSGTVMAQIEQSKTVVNFVLTSLLGTSRLNDSSQSTKTEPDFALYRELAQSSGGQVIEVTETQLPGATSIITGASRASLVTLLQVVKMRPGVDDRFSFYVDQSVSNLIVYITGSVLSFTLTSPSGVSQSSADVTGSLGTIQTVGNLQEVRLSKQVGSWGVSIASTQPYTLKVIGQSAVDFLFDFVKEETQGNLRFSVLETRVEAGGSGTMLVTVTGSDSVTVTEVALVETSGSGEVIGTLEPQGGDLLVRLDRIPQGNFVVRVRGEEITTTSSRAAAGIFQRQTSTSLRASSITLTTNFNGVLQPETPFSVNFTVATKGTEGNYTIRASNDRGFASSSPTSLLVVSGGVANGTVTLTAPTFTLSGSDVTLTIEAEAPGATDTNYVVLRLSVVSTISDVDPPVCQGISVSGTCTGNCSLSRYQLSANLTDGNGTGIESITVYRGDGVFNTSTTVGADGYNVTLVSYSASCCSPVVELVAVDRVGNVGSCLRSRAEGFVCSRLYISVVLMALLLLVGI